MADSQKKVFVAMSGGVDSSVAALLLQREGYDVVGAHMICADSASLESYRRIEHPDKRSDVGTGICKQAQDDRRDAMRVAAKLGIPFYVFDFRKEYREKVFDYMVREYALGRTPNPDVMCNSEIKFGIFMNKAIAMGADFVATGHYVRKDEEKLFEAKDKSKDQSYFLCRLNRDQISRAIFPIGNYLKSEVREIAKGVGLVTSEKKDSQGLCFVGKVNFQDFLRELLPKREGAVINSRGDILGRHDGAHFFTPGQRHGLRLGGFSEPLYVAEKNVLTNTIVAAEGEDDPVLYKSEVKISDTNWMSGVPSFPFSCEARIRYRQPRQRCVLYDDGRVIFEKPQRGVAPGQSAVFYSGEEMLGGGVIF